MRSTILLLAMLFSVAMFSQRSTKKIKVDFELEKQKFTGLWADVEKNNYYTRNIIFDDFFIINMSFYIINLRSIFIYNSLKKSKKF